ncbi:unnamed protein product [Allacma fusca]|uniref:Uncharacterized protein n=1 Tax=Allacma fusca TaxID=39272 RepID=A0A8J2PRW0_9HEXA|nr:unnamed protein product [Allacma fusca]
MSQESWPNEVWNGKMETDEDMKGEFLLLIDDNSDRLELQLLPVLRFSKWLRLVRSTAWVQQDCYPLELKWLSSGQAIERSSSLWRLDVFLDVDGVMRMRGRTSEALEMVAGAVNQSAVRKLDGTRTWCLMRKSRPKNPKMADLPPARIISHGRAFMETGMDFFGHVFVEVGRRREKMYGVLFTCLTVQAVHLEVAAKLTTDSAINAVRRFIDKRGTPLDLYTVNDRNLRGAERELREAM